MAIMADRDYTWHLRPPGAAGFELDVRRCGDGTIVVIHDATLDRTAGVAFRLWTYDQLQRFDAGHGDSVPRLADVLDEFGRHSTIHLELKEGGLAGDVIEMVQKRNIADRIVVSERSFP